MDEINKNTNDTLKDLLNSENLDKLSASAQIIAVEKILDNQGKKSGASGNLFGNVKENILLYCAFWLCVILLIFCGIDILRAICCGESAYTDLVENVIPVITLTLGYMLGQNKDK